MDVVWTLMDGEFVGVHAWPITALPEPEVTILDEIEMPDPKGRYMRVSIVELLPDLVSPLFNTLEIPAINYGIRVFCKDMLKMPDEDVLTNFIRTVNGCG